MIFVLFLLLIIFIAITGVLLVKKFSPQKTSKVLVVYGDQINPVYRFSTRKIMETEMKKKQFLLLVLDDLLVILRY